MGDLLERRAVQGMGMRVLVEGTIACNDLYFTTNPFFNETAARRSTTLSFVRGGVACSELSSFRHMCVLALLNNCYKIFG